EVVVQFTALGLRPAERETACTDYHPAVGCGGCDHLAPQVGGNARVEGVEVYASGGFAVQREQMRQCVVWLEPRAYQTAQWRPDTPRQQSGVFRSRRHVDVG